MTHSNHAPKDVEGTHALARGSVLWEMTDASGRTATIDFGRIALKVVPKSGHRLLRQAIGTKASAVTIEDGELVSRHDIRCRLHLDPMPNLAQSSFEHCVDGRRNLSILTGPDNFESPGHGEVIEGSTVWRGAAHGVVKQWH